jgi:GTP-dependent phosphoenolpyruvate carboxykinase
MTGLDLAKDKLERLFEVKIKEWRTEVDEVRSFLKPYKGRLPAEIREQYEKLERQVRSA